MKNFEMFFDIEKEEQWLNEQLQEGYCCTSGLSIYTFIKKDKRNVMQLNYKDNLSKKKLNDYMEFNTGKKEDDDQMKSSRIVNLGVIIIKD